MKAWLICVGLPFIFFYLPALWLWLKMEEMQDGKHK